MWFRSWMFKSVISLCFTEHYIHLRITTSIFTGSATVLSCSLQSKHIDFPLQFTMIVSNHHADGLTIIDPL